jgi:hypothetical protein
MIRHLRAAFFQDSRAAVCVLALLFAPVTAAAAEPDYTVDQSHVPDELWTWFSIRLLGPAGQEFVPQQAAMDVVELWISHGVTGTEPPTDLFARIREGSIGGPILGTSSPVTVLDEHDGPTRFEFAAPVALTPGSTYVVEAVVVDVPGVGNPQIAAAPDPGYPAGTYIVSGEPRPGSDLWFRTGLRQDVPARAVSWGRVKTRFTP